MVGGVKASQSLDGWTSGTVQRGFELSATATQSVGRPGSQGHAGEQGTTGTTGIIIAIVAVVVAVAMPFVMPRR